jgi:putative peptidoglycan lipid II flippase
VAALSLPLLVPVLRAGVRLRPTLAFPPGVAARAGGLALAGLAGLVAQQALVLLTLRLSNARGGTGAITVYQYVQAVYLLPYAVLAVPLAVAAFPQLSERAALADGPGYARTLARSTRAVLVAGGLGAAVLIAVAPAVGRFFAGIDAGRGGSGGSALSALGVTLAAFAPGLVGFALFAHLGRALFAVGRVRWAAASTVAGWAVAAVLSVVLVTVWTGDAADPRGTLLSLGVASSVGLSVAGLLLVAGSARVRLAEQVPQGLLAGVPRAALITLAAGAAATVAGRVATDALLPGGSLDGLLPGGLGHTSPQALIAGLLGGVVAVGVMVAAFAMTDGADLRAVLGRGRTASAGGPGHAERVDV